MSNLCQCKDEENTVKICIGQIRVYQKEIDSYFRVLSDQCEHNKDGLCHIPLNVYPITGVIICKKAHNCPLLKEKI
jgi:hypothetical protein